MNIHFSISISVDFSVFLPQNWKSIRENCPHNPRGRWKIHRFSWGHDFATFNTKRITQKYNMHYIKIQVAIHRNTNCNTHFSLHIFSSVSIILSSFYFIQYTASIKNDRTVCTVRPGLIWTMNLIRQNLLDNNWSVLLPSAAAPVKRIGLQLAEVVQI